MGQHPPGTTVPNAAYTSGPVRRLTSRRLSAAAYKFRTGTNAYREALRRVYEPVALIVQHCGYGDSTGSENPRGFHDERRLPCPEKTANYGNNRLHTRRASPSPIVFLGDDAFPFTTQRSTISVP